MQEQYAGAMRLAPRPILTGAPAGDSLENVSTFDQADGCLCWVENQQADYRLLKTSGLPAALPNVVVPSIGPGRWVRTDSGSVDALAIGGIRYATVLPPITLSFPFVNTPVGAFTAITPVGIVVNPASVLFTSPSPGVLRYIGTAPRAFQVTYLLNMQWTASAAAPPLNTGVITCVMQNAVPMFDSLWGDNFSVTAFGPPSDSNNIFLTGSTLLSLAPNNDLTVGVQFANRPTPEAETIAIGEFSLIAR